MKNYCTVHYHCNEFCFFTQAMKQESNDVKTTAAQVVTYGVKGMPGQGYDLDLEEIKQLVPIMVNGARERNTVVRSCSEIALAVLLGLRDGDELYQVSTQLK